MTTSRTVTLPSGAVVPALGQGTWHMGDDPERRAEEIAALRRGIDLGLTLIDTAEMYGSGRAEELVGEAVRGRRDDVFLVSKVLPSHADARGTVDACHASLRRLGTDRLDLYLLHWRGPVPLEETVEALEGLVARGTIGAWGVSNLDVDDLADLPHGRPPRHRPDPLQPDPARPRVRPDPRCRELSVPLMAYSPVEQGRLLGHAALGEVAEAHGATAGAGRAGLGAASRGRDRHPEGGFARPRRGERGGPLPAPLRRRPGRAGPGLPAAGAEGAAGGAVRARAARGSVLGRVLARRVGRGRGGARVGALVRVGGGARALALLGGRGRTRVGRGARVRGAG